MSWELIKGISPKPELAIKRCLRLDGVNDYLSLGNSDFYNVGLGEFTYHFEVFKPEITSGSKTIYRSSSQSTKGYPRIVFGFVDGNSIIIGLVDDFVTCRLNYHDVVEIGVWNKFTVVRRGTNTVSTEQTGWEDSIRNIDNLELYVNGIKKPVSDTENLPDDGLPFILDNTYPKLLGGATDSSSLFALTYHNVFCMWDRALSPSEISELQNDEFNDFMAKGMFFFDGTLVDSSSVGGELTLYNSITPPYVTYPFKEGVIWFDKTTANQIKTFKYKESVIITKVWKERSSYNGFQYSFDNLTWLNIPNGELVDVYIVVPANTTLYIKDSISRSNYNVLHLNYE